MWTARRGSSGNGGFLLVGGHLGKRSSLAEWRRTDAPQAGVGERPPDAGGSPGGRFPPGHFWVTADVAAAAAPWRLSYLGCWRDGGWHESLAA